MQSRSRPQRPRTSSPNAVRSAGTGQKGSTKCRRGGPVAAQRSSGLPRRQGGSPTGADGRGKPDGRRGGAKPGPDGRWHPRGRAGEKDAAGGAPSGQGATPRRDPGDCNALPPTAEISGTKERQPANGKAWDLRLGKENTVRGSAGAVPGLGQRKGPAPPLPEHGMERCRRRDRAGAEECPGAPPAYLLMGWRAGNPPPGETGGTRERCKGRDGLPHGRRGPCLPNLMLGFQATRRPVTFRLQKNHEQAVLAV